jgi:glycosyltransferase involved in cell wall biosynthesis
MDAERAAVMRIGFGVTVLNRCIHTGGVDGIGSYTRELFNSLSSHDDVELTPVSFGGSVPSEIFAKQLGETLSSYSVSAAASVLTGLPFSGAGRLADKMDLMHATDHLVPNLGKLPLVATLMDAIPLSHPEWVSLRFRTLKNLMWKRASYWADQIITISDYSKVQIEEYFGLPSERISVVPLGVDKRWFRSVTQQQLAEATDRLALPERFFLFVGTLQPRKNVARLLDAYRALPKGIRDEVPLLIVGRAGRQCEDIVEGLGSQAYGPSVRWLNHLADDDLFMVLKNATALVLPSLYEGFGLPVLEAFATGTPVITSCTTSLPEVAGDAAILVDPLDTSAISEAMVQMLENEDLAMVLRRRGLIRAQEYTWDRTAAMTVDVYRRLV